MRAERLSTHATATAKAAAQRADAAPSAGPPRNPPAAEQPGAALKLPDQLLAPALYPGHPSVQLRETHGSWVILAGAHAYKAKKPVRFGFLDYSTLERRRAACLRELALNSPNAPAIYEAVMAVLAGSGGLRLAPAPEHGALEYVLRMRRFDERRTLAGIAARAAPAPELIEAIAHHLAAFHGAAPTVSARSRPPLLAAWERNLGELALMRQAPGGERITVDIPALRDFAHGFAAAHAPEIAERRRQGLVRELHGDLRCEHILIDGSIELLDCIEFDDRMRRLDTAAELSFLTMDLNALGRRGAAARLIAAYRRAGGMPGSKQLRAFHETHWALVRAKVALLAADGCGGAQRRHALTAAARLQRLALRSSHLARAPLLIAVCGPAASGKSTLARALSRRSGFGVLSSDLTRKRLGGIDPRQRGNAALYSERFTDATYERLGALAMQRLRSSGGAILDASFHRREHRGALAELARQAGARLLFVHCKLPEAAALERARRRMSDPRRTSDATARIVAAQYAAFEPLRELPARQRLAIDAGAPPEPALKAIEAALNALW